jgi:glycerol-3-phosphate acyltransferase PlsY
LIVLFSSRMVSLSSMIGGVAFPFVLYFIFGNTNPILTTFSVVVAVLLIVTHRKNIVRILNKQESKIKFLTKKVSA